MTKLKKPPLVVIVGPTGVGKTSVSIEMAKIFNGEIVSADSRLLYCGMDIGTAKPTQKEMDNIPHHLIDVANPDETWSLAVYLRAAKQSIDDIHHRNKLPFLVGGTGQYVRAIIEGWKIPPQSPDLSLRNALETWAEEIGPEAFHTRLSRLDPDAAQLIDYRNVRRSVRAVEVILKTGQRFSDLRSQQECPYRTIILGIDRPRDELYNRIDMRIEQMLDDGLVKEVQGLIDSSYSPNLPTMSAIGYAEIIKYLKNEISLDEATQLIKRNTRVFVRRQANWFKPDDPRITWVKADDTAVEMMASIIRRKLYD